MRRYSLGLLPLKQPWECLRETWLKNKISRVVTETWESLRKMCLENKMATVVTEPTESEKYVVGK